MVRSQLTTSTYDPLWASFTEAERAVLYSLAQQEKTVQRHGYERPKSQRNLRDLFGGPEIHPLEKALWDAHGEARYILRKLRDRGIIHYIEQDGMLGFATPGFSDFVIVHSI
jgi:hypothetical protein